MNDEELFSMIGFIKISPIRESAILALENRIMIPTDIARETGYRSIQISEALNKLKMKNLVVCLNEEARKGRLYTCTEYGNEILKYYHKLILTPKKDNLQSPKKNI